ncbi:uncharacterized protein LOC8281613 [Ricinus communis]|uniref:Uncharacterized protein n=1 Tax=Ricinus communis TaxID=3988 RepID=B9RQB0_RICCO|nr:uncharacterized protein LOC8281613 [Ricinus communis]EEF46349.1 conserved hypothetical protein [Ricinus communis]|eukprot:XP_002515929.1 uncharacterized protein LOC8281613 [Ricinus communis]
MATNSLKSSFVTFLVFAMILSPIIPSEAARLNHRDLLQTRPPICPACVCCAPPPPGSCCRCCASPIVTESTNGSP